METRELLKVLMLAYPNRGFFIKPYLINNNLHECIMFIHGGDEIYNPFIGLDGDDLSDGAYAEEYGIFNQEHARLMRRHNLHYEAWVIHKFINLDVIYDNVVTWSKLEARAKEDPSAWLQDLGFTSYHTGGGCMAWCLEDPESKNYLLVTDKDGEGFPETYGAMLVGLYKDEGEPVKDNSAQFGERKKPMTEEELDDLAEAALNALCFTVQEKLGVTDGGPAGLFFSGEDYFREKIKKYIRFEIAYLN